MATYYFDTSALVKLYVRESGTNAALELTKNLDRDALAVADLARVEFRAAIGRRQRAGDISPKTASEKLADLDSHLGSIFLVQPMSVSVLDEACVILDRHPLRAYDAVQLAACVMLAPLAPKPPIVFVCSDQELLDAAGREGLKTFDPEADSI